ncbi:hypothetical protein CYY_008261 [Polysphondylium violaceum]|uniref:Uncharacterized protein n=1 Tax=Polysphondylium violaceum TaxID=133409 RepID=A0A8J4PNW0_9MYCE|nr:hypothetical protein CYY_008261 [Polysphondylium violaceum]
MSSSTKPTYIRSNGDVGKQTRWRISYLPERFWALLNTIYMFFHTFISEPATESYKNKKPNKIGGFRSSGYGGPGGGGGGDGSGRPGGGNRGGLNKAIGGINSVGGGCDPTSQMG